MSKYVLPFSILFLGICIVIGSWLISQSLTSIPEDIEEKAVDQSRYDFITLASDYFIIFDKQNGEYWMKIGDDEWEKQQSIPNAGE